MSTISSQTIRMVKPSAPQRTKVVAGQFHPLWQVGSWEDMVAAISLLVLVATVGFLVFVG